MTVDRCIMSENRRTIRRVYWLDDGEMVDDGPIDEPLDAGINCGPSESCSTVDLFDVQELPF